MTDGYYNLALAVIRSIILDALNGGGKTVLRCLQDTIPQEAISLLMGTNRAQTQRLTEETIERIGRAIDLGQGEHLKHLILNRDSQALQEFFRKSDFEDKKS
jgi:hypothetical protein